MADPAPERMRHIPPQRDQLSAKGAFMPPSRGRGLTADRLHEFGELSGLSFCGKYFPAAEGLLNGCADAQAFGTILLPAGFYPHMEAFPATGQKDAHTVRIPIEPAIGTDQPNSSLRDISNRAFAAMHPIGNLSDQSVDFSTGMHPHLFRLRQAARWSHGPFGGLKGNRYTRFFSQEDEWKTENRKDKKQKDRNQPEIHDQIRFNQHFATSFVTLTPLLLVPLRHMPFILIGAFPEQDVCFRGIISAPTQ